MQIGKWIDKDQFENKLSTSKEGLIFVFAADWCGYCKRFIQLLDDYKSPQSDNYVKVEIVDIDSGDGSLWDRYQIPLVPTIAVFKHGKEVFRRNGRSGIGLTKPDLEAALEAARRS
jgi:thiol-disulfide isomerase/thioredoxin